jgi:undecaprenyl diphosphate synthase
VDAELAVITLVDTPDIGAGAVRRVLAAAAALGIGTLTLFAFSADNWKRPGAEVEALMHLFGVFVVREREGLARAGVRLSLIGRRDRLPGSVRAAAAATESATAHGARLHLRLAIDYSARDAILSAAADGVERTRAGFTCRLGAAYGPGGEAPDVDLLIRTGGERRLSDFLLWESAYAELLFVPRLWPDFGVADLTCAVHDFRRRERRFGALGPADETRRAVTR